MGYALATRLLNGGCDLTIYNRTRSKAEPLVKLGARIVDKPVELADRDIVVVSVADSPDFASVMTGANGLLSDGGRVPQVVVDTSTVSIDVSSEIRARAEQMGSALLAAPVSGNAKVARAGKLTMAVSGPRSAFDVSLPYLRMLGASVVYVGEGESARLVKICHNLMLGIVAQTMAEIAVLAEKGGVSRADLMAFLNDSVMGSMFTRYKTPAYVNLDFTPTFTPELLLKDFHLGFEAAKEHGVPMPVAAAAEQVVQSLVGNGYDDVDFAALLEYEAKASGLELKAEDTPVTDGLSEDGDRATNGDRPAAARTAA